MKARIACLLGLGLVWTTGLSFLACGSGSGGFAEAGTDASTDTTTTFDVPTTDGKGHVDSPATDSPSDAGHDTGPKDSGLKGNCSAVNGPACDIVLNNCPTGHECVVVNDPTAESGLGVSTQCQPIQSSEHLAVGSTCCPGGNNPCDPGTTCIGNACIGDAGSGGGGGRCSPACCPSTEGGANTANCGASTEGYVGTCDINITEGDGAVLYTACTYESTCTIFAKPCGAGFTCLVQDKSGTSKCVNIYQVDGGTGGLPSGDYCGSSNSCAPELMCISFGLADGGSGPDTCTYLCYIPGGSPPFDAGIITSTPGMGGCPAKSTCEGAPTFLPSWLGVCVPS